MENTLTQQPSHVMMLMDVRVDQVHQVEHVLDMKPMQPLALEKRN